MLKSLKKRSYRFVVVLLLLTTLLTFDVGRVTKVEAVATTGAIIGGALVATGAIYLSYLALTGANVSIPSGTGSDIQDYLLEVGKKVSYYTSGGAIYQNIYRALRGDAVANLNNIDYTLTRDDLINAYNDFKDISLNQDIQSYTQYIDVSQTPTNQFDYQFNISAIPLITSNGYPLNGELTFGEGVNILVKVGEYASIIKTHNTGLFRNIKYSNNMYGIQEFNNGVWSTVNPLFYCYVRYLNTNNGSASSGIYQPSVGSQYYSSGRIDVYTQFGNQNAYPVLPNSQTYVQSTGEIIEVVPVESTEIVKSPQYPDNNDNDGKIIPVVPYVELPSSGNWGFNIGDLIQTIIDRAGQIITATAIGDLINSFKTGLLGTSQDQYYSYYNEGDTYNIDYYYNTYTGDYTLYNIDVSEQEDIIPVDLNTISQYTNNQYLTLIKERAETFGQTFGELVAFWHNCDPEIIYAFLGASIIVLLGAFIGKWGHS